MLITDHLFILCPTEALTLNSDVQGAAGSSVLVLGQAAVLSVSLRCDLQDFQH